MVAAAAAAVFIDNDDVVLVVLPKVDRICSAVDVCFSASWHPVLLQFSTIAHVFWSVSSQSRLYFKTARLYYHVL